MPLAPASATLKSNLRRPPVVIALLSAAAVLSFLSVSHLVHRFREQEKALARHLYAQGKADMDSGKPKEALTYLRAALSYQRDEFQYQLDLSRALRDSGQTGEARTYLLGLWQRSPDDGAVNLALGRLAAREGQTAETIHYYHNAAYGVWNTDAEVHRRNTQFELIDFLIKQQARAQAQAELITLAASLPADNEVQMKIAERFANLGDYNQAFSQYSSILAHDPRNASAEAGAGEAAFQLRRFRTAEKYLAEAAKSDPANAQIDQPLRLTRKLIESDPFLPGLSNVERGRRIRAAFNQAGSRLTLCLQDSSANFGSNQSNSTFASGTDEGGATNVLDLAQQWNALKPKRSISQLDSSQDERMMDLVFKIEQQTQNSCAATDFDQALMLLSQDRDGGAR